MNLHDHPLHDHVPAFDPNDPSTLTDAMGADAELARTLSWAHHWLTFMGGAENDPEQFGQFSEHCVRILCGMVKDGADRAARVADAARAASEADARTVPTDDRERARVTAPTVTMDREA